MTSFYVQVQNALICPDEDSMLRSIVCPTVFLLLICCARPIQAQPAALATTTCSFTFSAGKSNAFLKYCVTANGNILQIETPVGHSHWVDGLSEGYGLCNESPATEYHDYATGDSGNWNSATVVSLTTTAVQIARSTSDGHWTLTQTITKVPKTSSITIKMALTNNQAVDKVAYLSRYAQVFPNRDSSNAFMGATVNGAFAWSATSPPLYGLQLQNVGTPPFGFWQAYVRVVSFEPNACDFAANNAGGFAQNRFAGFVIAYVGLVPAHQTKTVTLSYSGL